jgi:hypothetical protein
MLHADLYDNAFLFECGEMSPPLKRGRVRALHTVVRDSRILQPTRLPLQEIR